MKKAFLFFFCILWMQLNFGQTPIGQFRCHIPLRTFYSVAVDDEYVYAATENGLLLIDKSTKDEANPVMSSWSKVDGLSDIDLTKISYAKEQHTLIICYDNGNLDLVRDDQLYNISDIKNKQISGSKKVSSIRIFGERCYLVYPFGVVVVNLSERIIEDTWFTKRNSTQYTATDMALSDEEYFISTDRGIFSLPINALNPANFSEWKEETSSGDYEFDQIYNFHGNVYANKNTGDFSNVYDTLYVRYQGEWMPTTNSYFNLQQLVGREHELLVCNWDCVEVLDTNLSNVFRAMWYQDDGGYPDVREAVWDEDNIWVADNRYGLVLANRTYFYNKLFQLDGPYAKTAESFCSHHGITALVPGSRKGSSAFSPGYQMPSMSWFEHQTWHYNVWDFQNTSNGKSTFDLTNIIINPFNESEWYVASWGNGLFKCVDKRVTEHYTPENSLLDSTSNGQIFVSGLAFDDKGNLWVTNSECGNMLKMMEPNGTWHQYNVTSGVISTSVEEVVAEHLLVDSRGYKWITFPRDVNSNKYNLVVFTENGTYDNPGDDQFARINMNADAEVNSASVFCIAEDLDGEIWIGTDKGIKVIYYPAKVFDGTAVPRNILLEQDGYVSVLFEFEEITAIAVDGANRKWIGTSKAGVFLMSENGQEQLLHFTAEDNPLFSDQITSIDIDPFSGEVFFGTAKGIVSYTGTATMGSETYEDLLVYPNPIRHGYTGPVAVRGLKANSLCKITDASGRLVWQGYSNGGELIWNCKDHFGKRPSTGVYYVMASDEDGKDKVVTKFLFIQ